MEANDRLLLQINDSLFPIGGYAHSYGLESYVQQGLVRDGATAFAYLETIILHALPYADLLAARLSWECAARDDLAGLLRLEELLLAGRSPAELRRASAMLGSRFAKTVGALPIEYAKGVFAAYVRRGTLPHPVVYGAFCADAGIGRDEAMRRFLYAQASAAVTNCVKLVPLSQTEGQRLLYRSGELQEQALALLQRLTQEDLGRTLPGYDLRSMQHERLYSRLYMS
jgi:urease accessory protein